MPRMLRTLIVVLLAALLPLRAVAAVTVGYCASGHQDMAVAAHGGHGQASVIHDHHSGDEQPASLEGRP